MRQAEASPTKLGSVVARATRRSARATTRSGGVVVTRRAAGDPAAPRGAPHGRPLEARLLVAALVVVALALLLVHRSFDAELALAAEGVGSGALVDLSAGAAPERLEPLLASFTDGRERRFVAERIARLVDARGGLPNVGELARATVPSSEIAAAAGSLPVLAARAAGVRGEPGEDFGVPLLSAAQLRELKEHVVVRTPGAWRRGFWLYSAAALLSLVAVHVLWRASRFAGDPLLLPPVVLLCGLGIAVMASVRDPLRDIFLARAFAQGVVAGAVVLAVASSLPELVWPRLRRLGFLCLGGAFVLSVLLVLFGTGPGTSDAKVNLFGFQPVPAVRLLVVLFLAGYFAERWEFLRELRESRGRAEALERLPRRLRPQIPQLEYLLPPIVAMAVVLGFFLLQRDLGPALVLALLFQGLYFVARGRSGLALVGVALLVTGFFVSYQLGFPRTVTGRIAMWLHPWSNELAGGDHLAQSLWAFSTGGLSGVGLGEGRPATVPEVHTDLVLAAVGEELGFTGLAVVLLALGLLLQRLFRIAMRSQRPFEVFLGLGLFLSFGLQVLVIGGGVLGLLPLTGIVTPFLSFGRSSMLVHFAMLGLAAALSARPEARESCEPIEALRRPARIVGWLVAGGLLAVLGKAAWVQIPAADDVVARGTLVLHADGARRFRYNLRLVELAERLPRGDVLDRNGIPLATSDPAELERFRDSYAAFGVILPASDAAQAAERWYPLGGRAYHLLGDWNRRLDWAASNTSFVERDENVRLQGFDDRPGEDEQPRFEGSGQRSYRELVPLLRRGEGSRAERRLFERDRDVRLTIDARLQAALAESLARRVREAGRERGAAVVIDAATGELLASASFPWPETGAAGPQPGDPRLLDRARYGLYPPGSTFKVVTAIAALRKDPGLAEKTYSCVALPGGRVGHAVRGWGKPIRDDPTAREPHGELSLAGGLRYSCNAFFAQLGTYDVGAEDLLRTAALFGIEMARPNTPEALADSLPQATYGQGQVVATPLEMARVAAAVANGGLLPKARWLAVEEPAAGEPPVRVLEETQAERLQAALRSVVLAGSASALRDSPISLAGKTGTAEVAGAASHSWFIGFAPFEGSGRTIAFAVVVEHGGYGGRVAVPVARDLVSEAAALGLLQ